MDPKHVTAIAEWQAPNSVHDVCIFLGFANFYPHFIEGCSYVITPLTDLLKTKNNPKFQWRSDQQSAFDELKTRFSTVPILCHFNPNLPICLHPDASDFAISGILSQLHDDQQWHPIAYWSRKCIAAEINYDIHNKELLAIVNCIKHWQHYLEGSKKPVQVLTDHKNLEVFMTTKVLTC